MVRAPAGNGIVLAKPLTEDGLRLPEAEAPFFAAPPRPGARLGLPFFKTLLEKHPKAGTANPRNP